jgi:hypothetical protein
MYAVSDVYMSTCFGLSKQARAGIYMVYLFESEVGTTLSTAKCRIHWVAIRHLL